MPRKSRKNVGVIGLGLIGSRVAAGLRSAGFHSFVWNRTPKPAPNFVGSPAEVAEICEIIQIFVADANAVSEVIEAMAERLGPRHIIINCATIGPEATVQIAQVVQGLGANFLDAPFTGSKGAAEKSQLAYYVGGDEEVFLRAKPVLDATSKAIVRCGRVGDASTLKVATNLITAVTTQTLAEALAIVRGAGITPEAFAAALEHNACKSGVVELKLPKMISGDYEPHFSVKHMFKDVQIGIHMANDLKLEVPLTTVVGGVLYGALCNGWGDLDFSSLYRTYSDAPKPAEVRALPTPEEEEAAVSGGENTNQTASATDRSTSATDQPVSEIDHRGSETDRAGSATDQQESATNQQESATNQPGGAMGQTGPAMEQSAFATDRSDATADRSDASTDRLDASRDRLESSIEHSAAVNETETPAIETIGEEMASAGQETAKPGDDEDRGLGGFFSRVFRRRGTPADK